MRGMLLVLLLVVSVILWDLISRVVKLQYKKQLYIMDGSRVFITMEHKPNGTMVKDRKLNISYYIVDYYPDKGILCETLAKEDLNAF